MMFWTRWIERRMVILSCPLQVYGISAPGVDFLKAIILLDFCFSDWEKQILFWIRRIKRRYEYVVLFRLLIKYALFLRQEEIFYKFLSKNANILFLEISKLIYLSDGLLTGGGGGGNIKFWWSRLVLYSYFRNFMISVCCLKYLYCFLSYVVSTLVFDK